jgi:hypothetical protein
MTVIEAVECGEVDGTDDRLAASDGDGCVIGVADAVPVERSGARAREDPQPATIAETTIKAGRMRDDRIRGTSGTTTDRMRDARAPDR